jgi:hypothetical protein
MLGLNQHPVGNCLISLDASLLRFVFPNFDLSEQVVAHRTKKWIKATETKTGEGADIYSPGAAENTQPAESRTYVYDLKTHT